MHKTVKVLPKLLSNVVSKTIIDGVYTYIQKRTYADGSSIAWVLDPQTMLPTSLYTKEKAN